METAGSSTRPGHVGRRLLPDSQCRPGRDVKGHCQAAIDRERRVLVAGWGVARLQHAHGCHRAAKRHLHHAGCRWRGSDPGDRGLRRTVSNMVTGRHGRLVRRQSDGHDRSVAPACSSGSRDWRRPVALTRPWANRLLVGPDHRRRLCVLSRDRAGRRVHLDLDSNGLPVGEPSNTGTRRVGENLMPTWSPDGVSLAYVSRALGIVVRTVATGAERVLATPSREVGRPRWSPDGSALMARSRDADGRYGWFGIDPGTGRMSPIKVVSRADESTLGPAFWDRDGQTILYVSGVPQRLIRLHLQDGREETLHTLARGVRFAPPNPLASVSSVDGSVAFVQGQGKTTSLEILRTGPDLSSTSSATRPTRPSNRWSGCRRIGRCCSRA